ncbi:MAG: hypothetical protein IJS22_01255 [Lachnospiraceae bacterium]|nr:hypothetical protein [Lachnospiraceae bacterium]
MKKFTALILVLAMTAALAGCGGSPDTPASLSGQGQDPQTQNAGIDAPGQDVQTQPAGAGGSGSAESCADLYDLYEKITNAMSKKISDLQEKHNEAVTDFTGMVNLWYLPFSSLRYVDAAMISADTGPSTVESAIKMLGNEDAQVVQDGKSYVITYTAKNYSTEQTYAYKEVITWDTGTKELSVVHYHDGEMSSFTEFTSLGGDRYAISSEFERAIVTYAGGEITEMVHAENIHDQDYETEEYSEESLIFTYDEGRILGRSDMDENWVKAAESAGGLFRLYELKDGTCHITGLSQEYNWDTGGQSYKPGFDVTLP